MNSKYNQSSSYALSITPFSAQFIHLFFIFREQSQGHYHIVCYNRVSAVIQIRELWATTVMVSDRLLKSRMTEPGGVQSRIQSYLQEGWLLLTSTRAWRVVIRSCPHIFVIFKWVALTLCVWEKVLHTLFKVNTFINTIGWRDWWAAVRRKEPCPELFPDWVGKDVANANHRLTHAPW